MKRNLFLLAALCVMACTPAIETPTGESVPDLGWLFLGKGPYVLQTKVDAAPGPGLLEVTTDLSQMFETADVVLALEVNVEADSSLCVELGNLEPGFYELRLRDTVARWNIGVRPDAVVSQPDAQPDFDDFWAANLASLDRVPLEPEYTVVPEYTNEVRTCYEVRYASLDGGISGGILSVPNAPGKYPVCIQYMGYGAEPFYFDPQANPDRIDYLVSVRNQGIFKDTPDWIDRGLSSKEEYYYRGAFCDAKRAVDFAASLEKADPERIIAWGESQGGALTFVAAALDSRIKVIAPAVPFLGDYRDYAKIVWWPVHEVFERADAEGIDREDLFTLLSYFDVKNFAPRITCPVLMSFGLQDPTCPPHTNFAIYNNLGSCDKHFICVPTCGHAMWLEKEWAVRRDAFLAQFMN